MNRGLNVTKRFRVQFTNVRSKLVFVPERPFQPSLMFVGKVRSLL
jgi:hypothetical protein